MGENVSEVTIGIMRLNGDIWLTVSVSDFGFVTSALALTLTALRTSQYIVFNVLSFVIQEAKDIRQIFSSSSFSCQYEFSKNISCIRRLQCRPEQNKI